MFLGNYHYRYFKKASWMNTPESSEYYSIVGNDTNSGSTFQMIQVKQPGMYIITSSVSSLPKQSEFGKTVRQHLPSLSNL